MGALGELIIRQLGALTGCLTCSDHYDRAAKISH